MCKIIPVYIPYKTHHIALGIYCANIKQKMCTLRKNRGISAHADAVDAEEEGRGEGEDKKQEGEKKEKARVDDLWASFKKDTTVKMTKGDVLKEDTSLLKGKVHYIQHIMLLHDHVLPFCKLCVVVQVCMYFANYGYTCLVYLGGQ